MISTYIDYIFGCACSIVKHGVTIDVQVLYFTQRQQSFNHLNVALFDGQLKRWHECRVICGIDALQHFGIAYIIDKIEVSNQVGQRPRRIVRQGIANLLQTVHVVKL